ncbi:hypothetical protein GCM10011512_28340 [Tersicoccus solisilvae]|uniref:DUF304 domain-containing protein n=1 Tax=Tersicoccus solisilvae TaxID=1882339 RepID=A0ABQ1PMY9_9MICC|nr:PH domain-containing protein [Tersicoccus solisilvae]GGC99764.1 hypothetical protein GCM10011512_28340 [Tersicoccus solisilvae]
MTSRALRRLLRGADPHESVLVSTRPRAHRLVRPVIALALIGAITGFALGWLSRRHADPVLVSMQPVLLLAVAIGALAAVGVFVLRPFLRWRRTRYVLTSARVIRRDGGRRGPAEVWLPSVLHVHVAQTAGQRLVRAGDLYIDSVGGRLVLPDAPHVRRFAEIVDRAVDRSRPGYPAAGFLGGAGQLGGESYAPGPDVPGPGAAGRAGRGVGPAVPPVAMSGGARGR